MTYFGERWLIPRLGRWATPDPLHVHASGGGEAGNSYHYVGGNLLQARDPVGLDLDAAPDSAEDTAVQSRLADSAEATFGEMARDASRDFGVELSVTRAAGSNSVRVAVRDANSGAAAAERRVVQNLGAWCDANGITDAGKRSAIVSWGTASWRAARAQFLRFIGDSSETRAVALATREGASRTSNILYGARAGITGALRMNPFTWFHRGPTGRQIASTFGETDAANESFGPLLMIGVHEPQHIFDCLRAGFLCGSPEAWAQTEAARAAPPPTGGPLAGGINVEWQTQVLRARV